MICRVGLCEVDPCCSGVETGDDHCPGLATGSLVDEVSDSDGAEQIQHGVVPDWSWLGSVAWDWRHQLLHGLGVEESAAETLVLDAGDNLGSLRDPVEDS